MFYNRKRAQVLEQFKKSQNDWREEIERHREEDERDITYRMALIAHARRLRNEKRRHKWAETIGKGRDSPGNANDEAEVARVVVGGGMRVEEISPP